MLISRDIKVLHLEPTDVCQASCPLCAREVDHRFDQLAQHHLTLDMIHQVLSPDEIGRLDKMFMCGNYGDPAAGRYTLDLYQHFRKANPKIVLGMNSNGGIQNREWWTRLGSIFQGQRDYVVFSIDGLADTNHIYRRGVDWHKMMNNIAAYINTGAAAHWDMLVYQHNQHQVTECEQLAKDMGFRWFRVKVSKRPLVGNLRYPDAWSPEPHQNHTIDCHALKEQSLYIDAQGRSYPCCWLGQTYRAVDVNFDSIQATWSTKQPESTCVSACGSNMHGTQFTRQWQREVQL